MNQNEALDLVDLDLILSQHTSLNRQALIPILLNAQKSYGYLSEALLLAIADALRVPLADIHGVIEFYTLLYNQPVGERFIRVCTGPVCAQVGGHQILEKISQKFDARSDITVEEVPCLCLCDTAPSALVDEKPIGNIDLKQAEEPGELGQEVGLGFIGGQERWLTKRCGVVDPEDIEGFIANDGFVALRRALEEMQPADVIAEMKESGLVGLGGAAFPTGLKWEFTANAESDIRYIVCNGDESEPGTFKDRVLMEGDPYSVLEGMAIAGYAAGAQKGYIYIRGEYPRAQRIVRHAIETAQKMGYLGEDILGSGFTFEVELRSGAGAYICGEETALFESIEGKRGFPRLKPPYPTTHGLFGKPTAINNVETLCAGAWIIANGAEAYRSRGTKDSPGLKLFCLSGDVAQPGVYEVPFGITIAELIKLGGGFVGEPQALMLGGAAGTFVTPEELDLVLSFEGLKEAGHSLGSGVVFVINQEHDLRHSLLSLAEFFAHESCGKCFPCRLGTQRQKEIVEKAMHGEAKKADFIALEDIRYAMTHSSICGLGMTAGTAIGSALELWPDVFAEDLG